MNTANCQVMLGYKGLPVYLVLPIYAAPICRCLLSYCVIKQCAGTENYPLTSNAFNDDGE